MNAQIEGERERDRGIDIIWREGEIEGDKEERMRDRERDKEKERERERERERSIDTLID